jgi:hypothetical protein
VRRPSAALVLALIAVVGVWAGPAVARQLFTSKDIRDRSIQGRDLKSNTITGRIVQGLSGRDIKDDTLDGFDIDESALGKVRAAEQADRAAVADALSGGIPSNVTRIHFARPNASDATVFEAAGLRVRAQCSTTGTLSVTAATAGGPAFIRTSGTRTAQNNTAAPFSARDDELRAGDEFDVVPGEDDNAVGQLVYVGADGATVTVDFLAEQGVAAARGFTCLFAGTAVHATP